MSHFFLCRFSKKQKCPLLIIVVLLMATIAFNLSCKKNETYSTTTLNDYFPLQTGKYITYQLDSLVYVAFGTRDTIRSYQVKYLVDTTIQDNIGRTARRIFRFIRKNNTAPWTPDATFMAVVGSNQIEWVENNMRFIKLHLPIENNFSWKGNSYIDTYSANSQVRYLDDWDYIYRDVNVQDTIGNQTLNNVLTVLQRDEIIGQPGDPSSYSEENVGIEKYAKGIGMVYKKFFHKEFQPGNGGYVADGSYGITLTMIDHN